MNENKTATQVDYEAQEMRRLHLRFRQNESATLADRQEAGNDFESLLRDPERLHRNAEWLLAGHYGFAEMTKARQIRDGRGNREAQLGQILAALDCCCPGNEARRAWKRLEPAAQVAADSALRRAMDESKADKEQE